KLKFRNCIGFDQHMKDSLINGDVKEMVVVERDKSGNINENLIVNRSGSEYYNKSIINRMDISNNNKIYNNYYCCNGSGYNYNNHDDVNNQQVFKNLKMIAIVGQCKTLNNEYIFEDDIKELIDWGVGQGAVVFLGHFYSADAFFKNLY
ncbi:18999_t:CDS:2, partial [Entrophospora sp. SA101]